MKNVLGEKLPVSYVFPEGSKRSNVLTCADERTTAGLHRQDKLPPPTHTHKHSPPPAFPIKERNLMICFCGRPRRVWGHLPVCFFSGTIVGSAQKGVLLGYSISCICCFKNTSATAREGHVLLIGTWPQTRCFLCLGESLRFNGCCIQRMMGIW